MSDAPGPSEPRKPAAPAEPSAPAEPPPPAPPPPAPPPPVLRAPAPSAMPAPREAATLLLVTDDPFEVLMVVRNARGAFPSALVFPGGAVDESDRDPAWASSVTGGEYLDSRERARRIAAIRETWEETGVLLARLPDGSDASATGGTPGDFRQLLADNGLTIALDELVPFAHWVTPVSEPRRFDTYFYLAAAARGHEAVADGRETVSARWVDPAEPVDSMDPVDSVEPVDPIDPVDPGDRGGPVRSTSANILFPTLMNLKRLAESSGSREAMAAAVARPLETVAPVIRVSDAGVSTITIPASAGYGLTEYVVPAG